MAAASSTPPLKVWNARGKTSGPTSHSGFQKRLSTTSVRSCQASSVDKVTDWPARRRSARSSCFLVRHRKERVSGIV